MKYCEIRAYGVGGWLGSRRERVGIARAVWFSRSAVNGLERNRSARLLRRSALFS
jgi:hypothetical protein